MSRKPVPPWKVLKSSTAFEDRWLKLRTDRCQTATGRILESYHIVELPDWVNVVAFTPKNELITVHEYRHGAIREVRGVIGGILEKTDATAEFGARREFEEETGYRGGHFFNVGAAYANPAIQNNLNHSFLAVGVEPGPSSPDPAEIIELELVPLAEVLRAQLSGEVFFQSLHTAAFHQAVMHILRNASNAASLRGLREEILSILNERS